MRFVRDARGDKNKPGIPLGPGRWHVFVEVFALILNVVEHNSATMWLAATSRTVDFLHVLHLVFRLFYRLISGANCANSYPFTSNLAIGVAQITLLSSHF